MAAAASLARLARPAPAALAERRLLLLLLFFRGGGGGGEGGASSAGGPTGGSSGVGIPAVEEEKHRPIRRNASGLNEARATSMGLLVLSLVHCLCVI